MAADDRPEKSLFDQDFRKRFAPGFLAALAAPVLLGVINWLWGENGFSISKGITFALFLVFSILWAWYCTVIGSAIAGTTLAGQRPYRRLRGRIEQGGAPAKLYNHGIDLLLKWLGRIFGDGRDGGWSAVSFDRWLLIGITYPLLSMFLMWVFNGGVVGEAEAALGFDKNAPDWRRILALFSFFPLIAVLVWQRRDSGRTGDLSWKRIIALVFTMSVAFAGAGAVAFAGAGTGVVAGAGAVAYAGAGAAAGAVAVAVAVAFAGAGAGAVAFAVVSAGAVAVFLTAKIARERKLLHWFLICFWLAAFLFLLLGPPAWIDPARVYRLNLVLFWPLLALVNAPFDWASLGLTRHLLRENLRRGGWWALPIALFDLLLALLLLVLLAVALVLTVQFFNAAVQANGGGEIYNITNLLKDLKNPATRFEPQYGWIYLMVFSTFIPSFANLLIGALALLRGIGPLNRFVLQRLPENGKVHVVDRIWLPPILALQFPLALMAAAGAIWLLLTVLFEWIVPGWGQIVLEMLIDLAKADIPSRFVLGLYD